MVEQQCRERGGRHGRGRRIGRGDDRPVFRAKQWQAANAALRRLRQATQQHAQLADEAADPLGREERRAVFESEGEPALIGLGEGEG